MKTKTPKHPDEKEARRLAIRATLLGAISLVSVVSLGVGLSIDNAGLGVVGIIGLVFATIPVLIQVSIDLEYRNDLIRQNDRRKWEEHQREQANLRRIAEEMGW